MVLKPAFTQPLQDWPLSRLCLVKKRLEYEPALFGFRLQVSGRAQVGLVSQYDEKLRLLTIASVLHHPRRDLAWLKRTGDASGCSYRGLLRENDSSQNSYESCE